MIKGISHLSHPVFDLADEIIRVNGRMRSLFASATAEAHFSPITYSTFAYIAEAKSAPTVPQIGRTLGHVRQVIQRAVNELVAAGLVEPFPNPNHKRAPLLQLSEAGKEFKQKSDDRVTSIAIALLDYLSEEQCRDVVAQLRVVRSGVEAFVRDHASDGGLVDLAPGERRKVMSTAPSSQSINSGQAIQSD